MFVREEVHSPVDVGVLVHVQEGLEQVGITQFFQRDLTGTGGVDGVKYAGYNCQCVLVLEVLE